MFEADPMTKIMFGPTTWDEEESEIFEFPFKRIESFYTLENNFTELKFSGEILDSDVRMHKARCPLLNAEHLVSLGLQAKA